MSAHEKADCPVEEWMVREVRMQTVWTSGLRTMQEMRMIAAYFRWRYRWERASWRDGYR